MEIRLSVDMENLVSYMLSSADSATLEAEYIWGVHTRTQKSMITTYYMYNSKADCYSVLVWRYDNANTFFLKSWSGGQMVN
jgi:hypothetical protein